jgi:hypothetical protein
MVIALFRRLDLRVPGVLGAIGLLLFLLVAAGWIALFAPRGGQITSPNPLFYAGTTSPPNARQVPIEEALTWAGREPPTRYALAIDGFNNSGEAIAVSGANVLPIWNEYFRQPLFSPADLQALAGSGDLRYVLASTGRLATFLAEHRVWLQANCENRSMQARMPRGWTLWDCA